MFRLQISVKKLIFYNPIILKNPLNLNKTMNKKLITSIFLLVIFVISLTTVSAALCKGKDGYYHDCKNYDYYCEDYYTGDLNWFREHKCDLNDNNEDDIIDDYFVYHMWSKKTINSRHTYRPAHYYTIDAPEHRQVTYDYRTVYPTITNDFFGFHNHFKIDSRTIPRYPSNIKYVF